MKDRNSRDTFVPTRRQIQLEDCLYEMIQTTPYEDITVADLSHRAGLSRRTYYSYFADKNACLCGLVDRYIRSVLLKTVQSAQSGASVLDICTILMASCLEQREFLDLLSRNQLMHLLLERAILFSKAEDRIFLNGVYRPLGEPDEDILACHLACQLELLRRWQKRGFDTSVEEMGRKYLEISRLTIEHLRNTAVTESKSIT